MGANYTEVLLATAYQSLHFETVLICQITHRTHNVQMFIFGKMISIKLANKLYSKCTLSILNEWNLLYFTNVCLSPRQIIGGLFEIRWAVSDRLVLLGGWYALQTGADSVGMLTAACEDVSQPSLLSASLLLNKHGNVFNTYTMLMLKGVRSRKCSKISHTSVD